MFACFACFLLGGGGWCLGRAFVLGSLWWSFVSVSMPLLWCHGRFAVSWSGLLSVLSGYQRDGESPLHVVWLFRDAVSERVKTVHFNVGGWVVSVQVWLLIIVACRYEHKIWLGVGSLWLMEVIHVDGLVTMDPMFCNLFGY
ncbi:hypothetical protein RchiOBHm_Chr7g0239361 [Rosa chinensis]|uniref:Transmembrane protein n=1 Tax=Rosa chinensis TaxID=74649 RepID=A0A2P6PHN8_ROSCH|nr:hypothetical protein RchiOBHm_Chr7g0239361 [Rosa chinensis]